ncbi:MAG: hypothetical protein ABI723_17875 [Bacteroidia bacterium]
MLRIYCVSNKTLTKFTRVTFIKDKVLMIEWWIWDVSHPELVSGSANALLIPNTLKH